MVRRFLIRQILDEVSQTDLLLGLNVLAKVWNRKAELDRVIDVLRSVLDEKSRMMLDNSMRPGPERRIPIVRQGILEGFRESLRHGQEFTERRLPPEAAALMLTHCVLGRTPRTGDPTQFGGLDAEVSIPVCINQYFYGPDDDISRFDRVLRLWRTYGPKQASILGGRVPTDLLREAAGLDLEDLITMAFAFWAHEEQWQLGDPQMLDIQLNPDMDTEKWPTFLALIAATPDEFAARLKDPKSEWDFLEFETHPMIRMEHGLLLMDRQLLMDRVTSGLYYFVLDHEKEKGDAERQAWQKAWGGMVEELAESCLRPMSPIVFGGGKTFFTEEDLRVAYPGRKQADVVIDYGSEMAVFEVVSGQLKIGSRVMLDVNAFREDFKKIVSSKLLQLDVTCMNLLGNPRVLTGTTVVPSRLQPVLIAGGRFPVNAITMQEIQSFINDNSLFSDARILPPGVLDLGEVEILEGLCERGHSPVDLISRWRSSDDALVSFRSWVFNEPGLDFLRPTRMEENVHNFLEEIGARLNFRRPAGGT